MFHRTEPSSIDILLSQAHSAQATIWKPKFRSQKNSFICSGEHSFIELFTSEGTLSDFISAPAEIIMATPSQEHHHITTLIKSLDNENVECFVVNYDKGQPTDWYVK